jgi:hypothetical protein
MAHPSVHRRHVCPRCGSILAKDERSGIFGGLTRLFFLRGYRCTTECGWRGGLRFSRSRLQRQKKRLRRALIVAAFMLATVATVRYMLSHSSAVPEGSSNEGIGEVAP